MSAYTDAVEAGLKGLQAVSAGACPGCPECADQDGFGEDLEAHRAAWHACEISDEGSFAWCPCGICGSTLGGNRERWHAILGEPGENLKGRHIEHFDDACTDCVLYIANGDEPEPGNWHERPPQ